MAKIYCDAFCEDVDDSECKNCCIKISRRTKCIKQRHYTPQEKHVLEAV